MTRVLCVLVLLWAGCATPHHQPGRARIELKASLEQVLAVSGHRRNLPAGLIYIEVPILVERIVTFRVIETSDARRVARGALIRVAAAFDLWEYGIVGKTKTGDPFHLVLDAEFDAKGDLQPEKTALLELGPSS